MRRVPMTVLALCAVAFACSQSHTEPLPRASGGSPALKPDSSETPGRSAASALLYMKGRVLRRFDLRTGGDGVLREFPTQDVALSADGATAAYVAPTAPGGDEDFVPSPGITLIDVATGVAGDLGPGVSPSFSPSGDFLAWLKPSGARVCEGETCSGESSVVVSRDDGDAPRVVLPPGRWSILGWAGDLVLAADQSDPDSVAVAGLDHPATDVAMNARTLWGASPDGDTLLQTRGKTALFSFFGDGEGAEPVPVDGTLGEGAWSPDSEVVAAVRLGAVEQGIPESDLVLLDRSGGEPRRVPGSEGAVGQVVWAPDSLAFVYARSTGPKGLNLEAVLCREPPAGGCRSLFSWPRGVLLLRLT